MAAEARASSRKPTPFGYSDILSIYNIRMTNYAAVACRQINFIFIFQVVVFIL